MARVIEVFVPSGSATPDISLGFFAGDSALIRSFVAVQSGWDEHNVRMVAHEIREIKSASVAAVTEAVAKLNLAKKDMEAFQKPAISTIAAV
jgi:hypothetical protein